MAIKFLTLNAGLLSVRFFGKTLLEPAGYVAERKAMLPGEIKGFDADIVTLQEVYACEDKRWIANSLRDIYPYSFFSETRKDLRLLQDSLMILSKYPLRKNNFTRFRAGRWDEYLLDTKGYSESLIDNSPLGKIVVFNVHTTAGALTHPESPVIDNVRGQQILQLLSRAKELSSEYEPILVGDFNCGPGVAIDLPIPDLTTKGCNVTSRNRVSLGNYQLFSQAGFDDCFKQVNQREIATWDPVNNPLNKDGEHADWGCPAQRIDHVFMRKNSLICQESDVVLTNLVVKTLHEAVPVSDHYGLTARIDRL